MNTVTLATLVALFAWPALAAPQCAPTHAVNAIHREKFNQARQSIGLDGAGHIVTVWASPSGSWAITISRPDGTSCLVGSGDHHTPLTEPAGEVM